MKQPLILRIRRTGRTGAAGGKPSYWQDFRVQVSERAYLLDALEGAWKQDPTLLFRHACHHASCGSCGLRVHGRERLACVTPALGAARRGVVRLEPLRNFPVVADLVVDTGSLAQKMEGVCASVVTEVAGFQQFSRCIECGLCASACPISALNPHYLGPAALAAAVGVLDAPGVRARVEETDGVWRCHGAYDCTDVCPVGVDPALGIGRLRRALILPQFKRKAKPHD
jgi:succinate dehydrogenase/fumarate reductase iron-sulfur protein